jgi:hypothetical protein
MSEDKQKKPKGGAREGAGRPSKIEEETKNFAFLKAIKDKYRQSNDLDSITKFLMELLESDRGKIWCADKFLGKPKEIIDQTISANDNEIKISIVKPKDGDTSDS